MTAQVFRAIEERWQEYLRLSKSGANYSAYVRLGEITNCLAYSALSGDEGTKWLERVKGVPISPRTVESIRREMDEKFTQLAQIVAVGGALLYEEALLAITLRVELEMLLTYLLQRGIHELRDVESVDHELLALTNTKQNVSVFQSAVRAAASNWGLPLRSKWLDLH